MVRTLECRRQRWANGWMDRGYILFLLCGLRLSYCSWVSFMIQSFQPRLVEWEQDMAHSLWRPLHSFLKERQIKHAWDGDRAGQNFPLCAQKKHLEVDCLPEMWGRKDHSGRFVITILTDKDTEHIITRLNHITWALCRCQREQQCLSLCLFKGGFPGGQM